jgi:hypothetical protein
MKAFLLGISTFLILNTSYSQKVKTSSVQQVSDSAIVQKYLGKSKRQKTVAWVCLIGGSGMLALAVGKSKELENDPDAGLTESINSVAGYGLLGITGIMAMVGSIPLFIHSKKNAQTAASISLTSQRILIPLRQGSVANLQSLTLTIGL